MEKFKEIWTLLTNKNRTILLTIFITYIILTFATIVSLLIFSCYFSISFSIILLNIIILLIYFCFTIFALYRTISLEKVTQDLEKEQLYNKTLTMLYDNIRGFKHDFNNIIQSIGGYISTDNTEGLKNYYGELLTDCQLVNNLTMLDPEVINNPPIFSLLTSKYHKAEESGIKTNLEIFMDLQDLNVNIYEFTRILGIILDNAIEAASLSSEKIINIIFRKDSKLKRNLFIIENTYSNKDVNTEDIFKKGVTTKSEKDSSKNHGLGLWEVRKIISKTNNLNLYTTKNNEFFKQQLEMYN